MNEETNNEKTTTELISELKKELFAQIEENHKMMMEVMAGTLTKMKDVENISLSNVHAIGAMRRETSKQVDKVILETILNSKYDVELTELLKVNKNIKRGNMRNHMIDLAKKHPSEIQFFNGTKRGKGRTSCRIRFIGSDEKKVELKYSLI